MKKILSILMLLAVAVTFAQEKRDLNLNKETNLIDVIYYGDNGDVIQTGSYTLEGKLQGEWLTYNQEGKKTVSATYKNGKKVGKWFFWNENSLREIDYDNNNITNVNNWKNSSAIADSN